MDAGTQVKFQLGRHSVIAPLCLVGNTVLFQSSEKNVLEWG